MQERIVEINLGDWSNDGHGRTDRVLVRLQGEDVSDAALAASYAAAVTCIGVDLENVCEDYEDNRVSPEYYDRIAGLGFAPLARGPHPTIRSESYAGAEGGIEFGAIELLMFYTGFTVEGFAWEIMDFPTLMGGFKTILKQDAGSTSFGYGLYF